MLKRTTFIGLDAHKRTITAAILRPGSRKPELITFDNTDTALTRFVRAQQKVAAGGPLRACYEAGPLGFGLQRKLEQLELPTDVIAPSQIWTKPGDHIKTDRRDAEKLTVLQLKANMLTVVRPPTKQEEAVVEYTPPSPLPRTGRWKTFPPLAVDLEVARRRAGRK